MYNQYENFYDMPQYVDSDEDNLYEGFGEGFEDEMISSTGSVFKSEDSNDLDYDFEKTLNGGK